MPASTAGASSCLAPDGQPAIGLDQIARTADALLPVLREAPSALAELDNFWPLSVDYETVTRTIQEALGTSTASVSMDPGVLSTLTPGDPLVDDLADGSTMVSMVGPYGVLFRVHVDASVPKETAVAGVRLLDDLVVLGGATPMTSLPPQTSGA